MPGKFLPGSLFAVVHLCFVHATIPGVARFVIAPILILCMTMIPFICLLE
jgi:hypothetical protein